MPPSRTPLYLVALVAIGLAGCDSLFGLDRVDVPKDAGPIDVPIDGALPPCKRGYPSVPLVEIPVGPYSSAAGDFNHDFKQDLAIAGTGTDTVEILIGNGDGTFAPARSYAARNAPFGIVAADLDTDGDLDLVVANDGGTVAGQISVLLGNGDGTFAAPTNNNPVGIQPRGLALADFDADGKLDLAVANFGTTATANGGAGVLFGNGDGTFKPQVLHTVGTNPFGIVVADFNEDTKPDIATANNGEAKIGVLLNTSTGPGVDSFNVAAKPSVQNGSIAIAVADFDGDTHADLVTANATANTASIVLGNGNGTFDPAANYDVGPGPRAVTIMDVDHDGKLDVLAANLAQAASAITGDGTLSWLRNAGNGAFETAVTFPTISAPIWMTVTDLDGDQKVDLAVVSRDYGFVHILLDPAGALPTPARLPASEPLRGAVADLDGDGHSDLAVASYANAMVELFLSGGGVLTSHTSYPAGSDAYGVALADLDGDTILDLVVSNYLAPNSSVWVRKGLGAGTFATTAAMYPVVNNPTQIAVGDLDLDGDLDLVVGGYSSGSIQILRNKGTSLTVEPFLTMGGTNPLDVATHDFDKDGRLDIVVSMHTSSNVGVRLATGPTTYGPALLSTSIDSNPFGLAIADLDKNGKADIVLADHGSGTIGVLSGTGDGTFGSIGTFPTTANPWGITLGDFDGDGTLDAATASDSRHVLTIVHGLGGGRFGEMHSYPVGFGPTAVLVGDFDGDGYPDFAVPNRFGDSITILQAHCLK